MFNFVEMRAKVETTEEVVFVTGTMLGNGLHYRLIVKLIYLR